MSARLIRCRSCGQRRRPPASWPEGVTPTICARCFQLRHLLTLMAARQAGYRIPPCVCRVCRGADLTLGLLGRAS